MTSLLTTDIQDYPLVTPTGEMKASPQDAQYYPLESSTEYKYSLAMGIFFRFFNQLVVDVHLLNHFLTFQYLLLIPLPVRPCMNVMHSQSTSRR